VCAHARACAFARPCATACMWALYLYLHSDIVIYEYYDAAIYMCVCATDCVRVRVGLYARGCARACVFVCVRLRGCVLVRLRVHARASACVFCVRACSCGWLESVCAFAGVRAGL
jgi:hypothetical protein